MLYQLPVNGFETLLQVWSHTCGMLQTHLLKSNIPLSSCDKKKIHICNNSCKGKWSIINTPNHSHIGQVQRLLGKLKMCEHFHSMCFSVQWFIQQESQVHDVLQDYRGDCWCGPCSVLFAGPNRFKKILVQILTLCRMKFERSWIIF